MAVVLLAMRSDLETASAGDWVGPSDSGVSVQLVSGYRYQIFQESASSSSKASCAVAAASGADRRAVALGDASKSYRDDRVSSGGHEFAFLGDFVAPRSGDSKLSCTGASKTLLVRPDDRPYLTIALVVLIGLLLGVLALVAFIVVLVLRVRRTGQARQATGFR